MAEVPLFAVDASAILKVYFQEESGSQEALDLMTDYVTGRVNLIGPHQLAYEVANVIRNRVLAGRLTQQMAQRFLTDFLAYRIPLDHPDGLIATAYDFCFSYGLSFYDSLYIALARIRGCSLITSDEGIISAIGTRLPLALRIEDYQRLSI